MTDTDLKKAEQRGYSKGYVAGRKALLKNKAIDQLKKEKDAFRRRAFLAVLPMACFSPHNWGTQVGGRHEKYTKISELTKLAHNFAEEAVKYF